MSKEVDHLKTGNAKRTGLGLALEASAKEILSHVKGETKLPTRRVVLPDEVDVKRIRSKARMSQAEFARAFCINPRTLQEWEQGRRKPDATTRAYLAVIVRKQPGGSGGMARHAIVIFGRLKIDGASNRVVTLAEGLALVTDRMQLLPVGWPD